MAVLLDSKLLPPHLQHYLSILYVLTLRNLKIRYRGSILGVYWSLLNPMIMTGVYTAIFGQAFVAYYDNSIVNYSLAAFTGLVITNFFVASTSQALASVVSSGALLNKIQVPISVFPLSMIAANLFQFSVGCLPLLAGATLLITHEPLRLLLLPLPLLELLLTCTGIGLLTATLYVFFRDLPYFYELITFALWMSSPVFYPAAIVPAPVRAFLVLNPLWSIIEGLRQVVLSSQDPNLGLLGLGLVSSVLTCAIGSFCFVRWREQFMDLL